MNIVKTLYLLENKIIYSAFRDEVRKGNLIIFYITD
jgi:hypothetical protein